MKIKLFYSYSHKNVEYREEIEKTLSLLKRKGMIDEWNDTSIIPGRSISESIKERINDSIIYLFLLSRDFIESESCTDEWKRAKALSESKNIYRIPIILENCAWSDFLNGDDVKALPNDGKPIQAHSHLADAYQNIYEGIKQAINNYQNNLSPRTEFIEELKRMDSISLEEDDFSEIFVFPVINKKIYDENAYIEIDDGNDIISSRYALIHGEEMSGKTTLCKYLFASLAVKEKLPSLLVDLEQIHQKKPKEEIFRKIYEHQFEGNYHLWKKQDRPITLIFDNLTNTRRAIEHILCARNIFKEANFVLSADTDQYVSYFKDDDRLSDFTIFEIQELSRVKLEQLIKKRISLKNSTISHTKIDAAEDKILQIIQRDLLPRYPIVVLSILQTFEAFMPSNIEISSYGHCYRSLIITHLVRSGIDSTDAKLNFCFNFLEHYAFHMFKHGENSYEQFKEDYDKEFVLPKALINRMDTGNSPIIDSGKFRYKYEFYYFLGAYLAKHKDDPGIKEVIIEISEKNYLKQNNIILMFVLHHGIDKDLVESIVLHSMYALDSLKEARLKRDETKLILDVIEKLPKEILSEKNVEKEREDERKDIDKLEKHANSRTQDNEEEYDGSVQGINDIYRILKNNQLFGQILRNHYGNLDKTQIKEILNEAINSGLRLVKLLLDEKQLRDTAEMVHSKFPNKDIEVINRFFELVCFIWTMENIERVTHSISVKELRPLVDEIADEEASPAHDIISYFSMLDTTENFGAHEKDKLYDLLEKHKDDRFIRKVLSIRTQYYFNTHETKHNIKQSICSKLGLVYKGR